MWPTYYLSNQRLQNNEASALSRLADRSNCIGLVATSIQENSLGTYQETMALMRLMQARNGLPALRKGTIEKQAIEKADLYSDATLTEVKENPVMNDMLLSNFEQQVQQGNHPIYGIALKQDRSFVEDPGFRLMFLRANQYHVQKAVSQMINFLYQKASIFGIEKVAQDITLNDLDPRDLELMLSGMFHIQDGTDRNGRSILYRFSGHTSDVDSEIRVLYYIWFNILLPNHSVQMNGVVFIGYVMNPNDHPNVGPADLKRYTEFEESVPIRSSPSHLCLKREASVNIFSLPQNRHDNCQLHLGSPIELHHQLSAYGIPQETFPIDVDGNLRESIRNKWFYTHLASHMALHDDSSSADEEDSSGTSALEESASDDQEEEEDHRIVPPPYADNDVLLGKGYTVQNHPGNVAFREFLREHQEEYDDSPRYRKREVMRNLTQTLKANGIRFWQKSDGDLWVLTSTKDAEKKVGQVFRSARKLMNADAMN